MNAAKGKGLGIKVLFNELKLNIADESLKNPPGKEEYDNDVFTNPPTATEVTLLFSTACFAISAHADPHIPFVKIIRSLDVHGIGVLKYCAIKLESKPKIFG